MSAPARAANVAAATPARALYAPIFQQSLAARRDLLPGPRNAAAQSALALARFGGGAPAPLRPNDGPLMSPICG